MSSLHRRPVLHPSGDLDRAFAADDPSVQHRIAHETSWAILHRVRRTSNPQIVDRVVRLAQGDGIDDLAELWADASAHTLAGMLWRLYLLRRVAEADPETTAQLFRMGSEAAVTIDPVVAGASTPITPASMIELCDTILRSAFRGDLADALERAASYCRIMGLGAAALADSRDLFDDEHAAELTARALRYAEIGRELHAGARSFRAGRLD